MVVQIRVEATRRGLNQVTSKLSQQALYQLAWHSLDDVLTEMKHKVKDLIYRAGLVDTGRTAENIYQDIYGTTLADLNGIVASPDSHFSVLEFGRRVGARMPPEEPIALWAERHGIRAEFVYPIRRAISRRGQPAHLIMTRALEESRKHFATVWFNRFLETWGR